MLKFIALIWDPINAAQSAYASELSNSLVHHGYGQPTIRTPGLHVYCSAPQSRSCATYPFDDGSIVLGKLFRGSDSVSMIGCDQAHEIRVSQGRHLLRHYWGRYVALMHDRTTFATRLIRDPTGAVDCFLASVSGLYVAFSHVDDCIRLGIPLSIHWDWIREKVASQVNERLDGTGIREIAQVHAGECVRVSRGRLDRVFYWDPAAIASTDVIEKPREAVERVRDTVRQCVHTWASCYEGIVHRLSGGLDSSIVAACLGTAPKPLDVTCFNHYSPGADSDERAYARVAASKSTYPLVEHPRDPDIRFDQLGDLKMHPCPLYYRYSLDYGRYEADLARQRGATAIFSGEWGDALFYLPTEIHPAIDYVARHGLGVGTFQVALDAARLDGRSVWSTLYQASIDGLYRKPRWDHRALALAQYRSLLAEDVAAEARTSKRFAHPWLIRETNLSIGKFKQIFDCLLVELSPLHDHLGQEDDAEHVAPLNSQPLVELCLRIPTYVHTAGGWNRAVARRAFADSVPAEIITRRTKGGVDSYQKSIFLRNVGFVRELLLDGELVRQGVLDRRNLEAALFSEPTRLHTALHELYWYMCTEAWIASWLNRRPEGPT